MPTNFLICVDQSPSGTFAFDAIKNMYKDDDQIYVLHVISGGDKITTFFESNEKVDQKHEDEIRKILTFYGNKAQEDNIPVTLVGSTVGPPHKRILKVVKQLKINHLILGRRPSSWMRTLTATSTSKSVMEKVECDVTIAKQVPGAMVPDEKAFTATLDSQDLSSLKKSDRSIGEDKSRLVVYELKGAQHMPKSGQQEVREEKKVESPRETERPREEERKDVRAEGMGRTEGMGEGRTEMGRTEGMEGRTEGMGRTEGLGEGRTEGLGEGRIDVEQGVSGMSGKKEKEMPRELDQPPVADV